MKITDHAAQIALTNGGFLLAGDYSPVISKGEIIDVTEHSGLVVERVECTRLINAPLAMVMAACREHNDQYQPHYSELAFELPHHAATAKRCRERVRSR